MSVSGEIRQVIENSHLFSGLTPGLLDEIASSASKKTLGAHEMLFQKGDRADALWGVLSGRILIEVRAADGKEMVLDEFHAGDIFGEVGVLDFGPRRVEATAACKSELFRIERSFFLEQLHANPELCFRVFSLLCTHLRDTTETLEDTVLYRLPGRLAKRLIVMLHEPGNKDCSAILNVVQSDLARMMGVHREAVNRQLRAWEKSGWISIQRQRIEILEEKRLVDLAAPGQVTEHQSWATEPLYSRTMGSATPGAAPETTRGQPGRRLAGILAVDCTGYAGMLMTDSKKTIKRIKAGLTAIDKAISDFGGQVVWSAGDRTLAEFPNGLTALEAALEIQGNTADTGSLPDGRPDPLFRIGVHAGEILISDGRIIGEPVNIAISLSEITAPGGICLTGEVVDMLEQTGKLELQYLGKHELKKVVSPVNVFSASATPWLKRIALRAETLVPRRFRLAAVTAAAILVAGGFWFAGDRVARQSVSHPDSPLSIAVLPFSTGDNAALDYIAQGIPDEIRELLSMIPVMRVIGRESSGHYFGRTSSAVEISRIGKELNVTYIIEGSIQNIGDQMSITARLLNADDGTDLWSETFNQPLDYDFEIHNEVVQAVIDELQVTLFGTAPSKSVADPEVYALYLKGRYFWNFGGRDNHFRAFSAYQQALAIDPEYAPAWVGVSWHYQNLVMSGELPPEEGYALILDALENALSADNGLAQAWSTLGYVKMKFEWDWQAARAAIDKALQLEPNNPDSIGAAASLAQSLGQFTANLRLREKKVDLDPLNLSALSALGQVYILCNRPDDAMLMFERIVAINPDFPGVYENIGRAYLVQGDADKALIQFNQYPPVGRNVVNKARAHVALGNDSQANAIVDKFLETESSTDPFWTAAVFVWRHDNDRAFEWLETAFQQRNLTLNKILSHPELRDLQSDPRFPAFLEKLGLLEAWNSREPSLEMAAPAPVAYRKS